MSVPLFDERLDAKYETWFKNLKIKYHDGLSIIETKDKGIGMFFKFSNEQEISNRDIELLRIPSEKVFNIQTCLKFTNSFADEEKKMIKNCLSWTCKIIGNISESLILIAYFIGFLVVKKINKMGDKSIDGYLQILLETRVNNLHNDNKFMLEDLMDVFKGNALLTASVKMDLLSGKWEELVEVINEEFKEKLDTNYLSLEEVLQLCSSIRSRTLEIPRSIEDIQEEENKEDEGYYVDVTLVPILDFVNHDNFRLNSYFDIDRKTKEILLKLDCDRIKNDGEFCSGKDNEIFISYSGFEDLTSFFINYGFLPRSESKWKCFELPIFGYFKSSRLSNLTVNERLYCIRQSPNVQFLCLFNKEGGIEDITVNMEENYSYLIFDEEVDWRGMQEDDEQEQEDEQQQQEEDDELALFEKGYERSRKILGRMSEGQLKQAKLDFFSFLQAFFRDFTEKITKFEEIANEYELSKGEEKNLLKLLDFYEEFIAKFRKFTNELKGDQVLQLMIEASSEEWLPNRMMPIYNFSDSSMEQEGVQLAELKLDDYDGNRDRENEGGGK